MTADILLAGMAGAVPEKSGHRIQTAGRELASEDISGFLRCHGAKSYRGQGHDNPHEKTRKFQDSKPRGLRQPNKLLPMTASKSNPQLLANLRRDYAKASLDIDDVTPGPREQFEKWLNEAISAELPEPNAMTLATVDPDGRPSARIVLIRRVDDRGITFFTNYDSRKGQALAAHPWASLVFFWPELERQIRIEGRVEKIDGRESDDYFHSRPIGSKLGAWASPQSEVIPNREWLELRQKNLEKTFPSESSVEPPRPQHWGGYLLVADCFEFWQGRRSRLHDRIRYRKEQGWTAPDRWIIERLAP